MKRISTALLPKAQEYRATHCFCFVEKRQVVLLGVESLLEFA